MFILKLLHYLSIYFFFKNLQSLTVLRSLANIIKDIKHGKLLIFTKCAWLLFRT